VATAPAAQQARRHASISEPQDRRTSSSPRPWNVRWSPGTPVWPAPKVTTCGSRCS